MTSTSPLKAHPWVTTLTETGFPRDLLIQWTWVSFLGPHWVPLFIWLTVAQVLEQLEEQLSCWISAKTLKNGDDVLKGHSVFFLVHGTFSQDPVSFPKLLSACAERALACDYKDTGCIIEYCQALGKLSYCSGFHLSIEWERDSKPPKRSLSALTSQDFRVLNLGACYLDNSRMDSKSAQSCSVTVRWSVY